MGDIIFQDGFQAILVQLEQAGLELRNESFSTALTQYMETMSKKLHRKLGVQKASSYIMDYFPENERVPTSAPLHQPHLSAHPDIPPAPLPPDLSILSPHVQGSGG